MTRRLTVAQMRGKGKGAASPTQTVPRPGTRRRLLYDLLVAHRGHIVEFNPCDLGYSDREGAITKDLETLRNDYEMDIRCLGARGRGIRGSRWLLAGEWDGKVYIDYVVNPGG